MRTIVASPGGETGRHKGLKIPRPQGHAGSIPAPGTPAALTNADAKAPLIALAWPVGRRPVARPAVAIHREDADRGRKPHAFARLLCLLLPAVLTVSSLQASAATAQRTFVASTGNDANPCTLAAPCRGFAAAIANTKLGGEVIALDSAGYGPVTITQAVTITAPGGVYAGVSVATGDGITINAPGAEVTLRGLTITGIGGLSGVHFTSGALLRVEACEISGFMAASNGAIKVDAPDSKLYVSDAIIRDSEDGIIVAAQPDVLKVVGTVSRSRIENNARDGILPSGAALFVIEDSVIVGSLYDVVDVDVNKMVSSTASVNISRTLLSHGEYGVFVEPSAAGSIASVSVLDSTISEQVSFGVIAYPLCNTCAATAYVTRTQLNHNSNGVMAEALNHPADVYIDGITAAYNTNADVLADSVGATVWTRQTSNFHTFLLTNGGTTSALLGK